MCSPIQEYFALKICPYTKGLLERVFFSSSQREKNDLILEMQKLVCDPSNSSLL
jgi:hypothetical protein